MLLLIIPSFMLTEALEKSVFLCLLVFLLSYVFFKRMKVVGHNNPEWFSLTELSSGNDTRQKVSHGKVLTRKPWADFTSSYTPSRLSDDLRILWNVFLSFITVSESRVLSCHHTAELAYTHVCYRLFLKRGNVNAQRGHNECGTVCGFNPATSWAWPLHLAELFCDIHDTLWNETFTLVLISKWHHDMRTTSAGCRNKTWQIESAAHFRDPKRKRCPPAAQRNREKKKKKNCCRCEYGNIFTYVRERGSPVWKKNTHSNWQQGVHKEWIECGVWEKRVK